MEVQAQAGSRVPGQPWGAHCRRVAALACELGRRLRLPPAELIALEEAALHHHAELSPAAGEAASPDLSPPARAILHGFRNPEEPVGGRAAAILRVAEAFAERVEFLPFQPAALEQIIDEMNWLAQKGLYDPVVTTHLTALVSIRLEDLLETVHRLPVFPAVALRALMIPPEEETSLEQMESLVSSDQVLAGAIVEAANSAFYNPCRRIATIAQALSYIGVEGARRVVLAQVFRPLFACRALGRLWRHAVETAVKAERLASLSRAVNGQEAFLAGLVHDVGRLALHRLGGVEGERYARLREKGADAVFVEMMLCGFDHGVASAEILRSWSFPAHMVEAVEHHHRPEASRSPMAALLHVAESWSEEAEEEDLPSPRRVQRALKQLGLTADSLKPGAEPEHWLLACLLEAA
ncbi:MAG: HDOD domain-containing protein [Bryobacteraceae bacterium]|nr:HDOD domain-containing protein [Bryobacteraceae bacterium]